MKLMKLRTPMCLMGILMCLLMIPSISRAQEQSAKSNNDQITHLRVDIVLTEYNGDQKISSLPYTIYTASWPEHHNHGRASLRMGVKVPVADNNGSTYMNVGTDIDSFASTLDDGSYDLEEVVHRSSIYAASQGGSEDQQIHTSSNQPVIRNFNTDFQVALRDGETREGTSATDPLNGHVLKISVTLHVLK